ncbi:MAG: helix-turn-helix transcriptional regulator [Verrucomicrobiota bacterium]
MLGPSESERFLRQRLRVLRKQAALTQATVSELAGISYDYYKDIEQGVRPNVSIRMAEQLAKVYGLSIHELFSPEIPVVKAKLKAMPTPHYRKGNP